jgi:hypothetical protein
MKEIITLLACTGLLVFGISSCQETEWYKESKRQEAIQEQRDRTPHVIREADGCKVYAFKGDGWHYFTRCGETVTTERTYQVKEGKTTKTKTETIATENNK